ncbi:MAG: class I SAM-dependent methyltransferase [Myxococcota bacterium]
MSESILEHRAAGDPSRRAHPDDPYSDNPYVGAYPHLAGRRGVWREIVRWVRRDAPDVETLVELGCGYGDFIDQFPAKRRIAFDLNPEMRAFLSPEVELRVEDALALGRLPAGSVDLVFASNFLEHLTGDRIDELLEIVQRVLRPGGRLMLIQPNHRRCAEHYFDDPTHVTIFDDQNIGAWLERAGLCVVRLVPGLLPFTMNSRAPKWPLLVALYLRLPIRPLAAQMYVVAEKR